MADAGLTIRERFDGGSTFEEVLARPKIHGELWESIYRRAVLDEEAMRRASAISGNFHLLVINEDWCGDSANILPWAARLAEASEHLETRIIGRDANRDLMDAHMTGDARSIPIIIVYDAEFRERGHWGPRPAPLQHWVMTKGLALPKPERYPHIRAWYARDKGRTIVSELLSIIESV